MRGGWPTAIASALLVAAACSPQCGKPTGNASPTTTPVGIATTPSPSPSPTAALQTSAAAFHAGEVGVGYSPVALSATGGAAPYSWSVFSGTLPAGLTLGTDGSISGTPATAGSFAFTVQVTDAGGSIASIPATIAIAPALSVGLIGSCARYCNVELGCDSTCGAFGQQSGGVGPYTYSLTGGQLPSGTSLNGLSLKGTFKGLSGWLQFTVQVTDSLGGAASVSPKFWMYDHISLSGGTCGPSRFSCKVTLPYSGGQPGQQVTAAPTAWSPGSCSFVAVFPCPEPNFSVAYQPGSITITLTYQPNSQVTFGTLTVQLTSSDPCGKASNCTASAPVTVQG